MAGILDRKNRVIDFILTPEGYKQMSLHDIRFKYATFSDNSTIYHSNEENEFLSGSHNFRLEASNNTLDLVNPEIDLNRGGIFNLDLSTEDSSLFTVQDLLSADGQTFLSASNEIYKRIGKSLKDKNILITTSSLDKSTMRIYTDHGESSLEYFNLRPVRFDHELVPTLIKENVTLSEFELLKNDGRFANKTNFLYLPPVNENNTQLGEYVNTQEGPSKSLVRNSVNGLTNLQNAINDSIKQLNENNKIQKKHFYLSKSNSKSSYIFQVYNVVTNQKEIFKLTAIDHGDIQYFDNLGRSRFRRVFSLGRIYRIEKNSLDPAYLQSDKQIQIKSYFGFANIFTVVFEE